MSRLKIHEPKELKAEFDLQDETLETWCASKKLSYTYTSRLFAKIERDEQELSINRAKRILAKSAPIAANKLIEHIDAEDQGISLKASVELLNRVGINGYAPQVNITNNNTVNMIAPLFKEDYSKDVNLFLDDANDA